jgi:O-antigen/teichoic acid export membrane protein
LLVLVVLAPIDAFDSLLQHLSAIFCSAKAIFFRRQVLGPSIRLAAIVAVAAVAGDAYLLAYGYLAGGLIGIALYIVLLVRQWRRQGLLHHLRPGAFTLPVREVFGFSLPMLSTELSVAFRASFVLILLEYFRNPLAVGEYRAVVPLAGLNMVVFQAFGFLFVPLAARLHARGDVRGVGELYWLTSLWIAILTFPVFVITCFLAPAITVLLFGERYAQSATLLAILAVGHYFNAALGFNAATLRVHGKVRTILASDTLTAVVAIVLGIILVRRYGALGAAVATTATYLLQNVLYQVGLRGLGIGMFSWPFLRVYVLIAGGALAAAVTQWLFNPPVLVPALLATAVCLIVVRVSRRSIDPTATFPELRRVPMLRWLLE